MKTKTTDKIKNLTKEYGMPLGNILVKVYAQEQSLAGLARVLGVSQSTVSSWILLCNLRIESRLVTYQLSEEGHKLLNGSK